MTESSQEQKDFLQRCIFLIWDFVTKKYDLAEIVKGDSVFCATGITSGDLVTGIKIEEDKFISETLLKINFATITSTIK